MGSFHSSYGSNRLSWEFQGTKSSGIFQDVTDWTLNNDFPGQVKYAMLKSIDHGHIPPTTFNSEGTPVYIIINNYLNEDWIAYGRNGTTIKMVRIEKQEEVIPYSRSFHWFG